MGKLETTLEVIVALVLGALFMGVGLTGAIYLIKHPSINGAINSTLVMVFIGVALLGALMIPSIFTGLYPRVQKIFVLVFPGGLSLPWGRRAGDQPPPANPPSGPPQGPPQGPTI